MKKIIPVILFLICFHPLRAQLFTKEKLKDLENFDKERWSWGYFLGFNTYDFKFDYRKGQNEDIKVDKSIGFNVGLIGNMRINDYMDLRLEPGVMFVNRDLTFPKIEENGKPAKRDVKSTYIHLPLLIKFSTKRINNFKPYVMGGISTSFNLSSNENNRDDNEQREFRMKTHTFYYELEFGIDFYLYFFKFTPSVRGVFAISDELKPDNNGPDSNYIGNVESMKSRGIFINLKFQ